MRRFSGVFFSSSIEKNLKNEVKFSLESGKYLPDLSVSLSNKQWKTFPKENEFCEIFCTFKDTLEKGYNRKIQTRKTI